MQRLTFVLLFLFLCLHRGRGLTPVVVFPDCADGSNAPATPVCVPGGPVINPASANPLSTLATATASGTTQVGWRFVASPVANNFAISIYTANSTTPTTLFPTAACRGLTYGALEGVNAGTVWAVVYLFQPSTSDMSGTQPILGIFGGANAPCPVLYTLPTGRTAGGPMYVYTNFDDGSYPAVLTRVQLSAATFPCTAPMSTSVAYVLLGTMAVATADFAVAAAGFSTQLPGCNANYVYAITQ